MNTDEVIIKILGKTSLVFPNIDQLKLRSILEEVLYDYDVHPITHDLVPINNIMDKVALYLCSRTIDGLSKITIYNKKLQLTRFARMINKNIEDINAMDIRIYLANISKEFHLKDSSLLCVENCIRAFFSWLMDNEYITRNPMNKIKPMKVSQHLRKALTIEEIEMLMNVCKTNRQRAMVSFFFSAGVRLGELIQLNINNINWDDRSVVVYGKGKKERKIFFSVRTKLYLQKYIAERNAKDNEPLFITLRKPYKRLSSRAVEREIHNIAVNAGFNKSVFPHLLRHSYACSKVERGMNIMTLQKLMGHSELSSTEIYAKMNNNMIQQEYNKTAI